MAGLAVVAPTRAEVVSREEGVTSIDAYGGYVVWSSLDSATDRWSLRVLVGGQVQSIPVAPRPVPFDVDLGPGSDGDPVAVYSRCRREIDPAGNVGALTRLAGGGGCRIFLYSFATRTEVALPILNSKTSEFTPAIWKDRLTVFAKSGASAPVTLRTRAVHERTRGLRLPAGSPGRGTRPVDVDLRGRRVAFTWQGVEGDPCSNDGRSEDTRTEAWTVTVGGQRQRLARECAEEGAPALASATVFADAVGYLRRLIALGPQFERVSRDGQRRRTKVNESALDVALTVDRTFSVGRSAEFPFLINSD